MIRKRKRQILSKGLAFFFLLTLLLQTVTVRAGEQDSYHSDARCSLTIELKDLGTRPEHTVFDIYQVGTVEAETSLHFRLLDRYRKTGINLKRIRLAEEQEEAAAKLTGVLNEDTHWLQIWNPEKMGCLPSSIWNRGLILSGRKTLPIMEMSRRFWCSCRMERVRNGNMT